MNQLAKDEMDIIRLKNVQKKYQLGDTTVHALRGLDLTIKQGDFTALIGASGAGKSTLLNIIGCLDSMDSGDYFLESANVNQLSENQLCDLRNQKIGFIFQSFNLISVLTVKENIELPLLIQPEISADERHKRITSAIDDVGLGEFINHMPNKLSGGQRQRVAIARALVTHPSLILADEPTANLDSKTAHKILDLMYELNQTKKVTFLFCSHDEKLINRAARVIKIEDGLITQA